MTKSNEILSLKIPHIEGGGGSVARLKPSQSKHVNTRPEIIMIAFFIAKYFELLQVTKFRNTPLGKMFL
jgi:hypothetical protein